MGWDLRASFGRLREGLRSRTSKASLSTPQLDEASAVPEPKPQTKDLPILPPTPRELITGRVRYEVPLLNRKVDHENDTPISALYRMYEHIMLDQHIELRNELEAFWFNRWPVRDIPDPHDPDAERYACLSCIPRLICLAFNKRIDLGLPREAPAIFTGDQLEEWKARDKVYEQAPEWIESAPKLEEQLPIPHWDNDQRDFVPLGQSEHEGASKEFLDKNVLVLEPHIHFV